MKRRYKEGKQSKKIAKLHVNAQNRANPTKMHNCITIYLHKRG